MYDQTFTSINLSSNGNAQFTTTDATFTNQCLPWLTHNYTIFPYWDDLYLVNSGFGIFTSISGTAPNRIFNIEWRAQYFPGSGSAGFELRLYEGQLRFDVIYGTVTNGNTSATAGVQRDNTFFTQYFCNGSGGAATGGQSYVYIPPPCPTPTPSSTPTATATATVTPTATTATALQLRLRLRQHQQRPRLLPRLQRQQSRLQRQPRLRLHQRLSEVPHLLQHQRLRLPRLRQLLLRLRQHRRLRLLLLDCDRDTYTAAYSVTKGYSGAKASADSRAAPGLGHLGGAIAD